MKVKIKNLTIKKDERGWLAEILNSKDVYNEKFGLALVTTALPGQTKGKHYHKRKKEWYCVIVGNALLTIKNRKTKEIKKIKMGENKLKLIQIPTGYWHSIKNIGNKEMILLAYVSEPFNSSDPDTFYE